MSHFNAALIEGLWRARNNEGPTPLTRTELRLALRRAICRERAVKYERAGSLSMRKRRRISTRHNQLPLIAA